MESPTRATKISELEGQHLGSYQIVELIGRGGMAVVYKAMQPALRRYVAIKVLPPYFVHEENFRARFQQEAETVARLEHPNILPIFDYGQQGDIPYIVMPLITGGTLRDWLSKPVPLPRALQVFSRILQALDYAHAQGIVHRDIKPGNILMSQGDWPLLTDFGIAKLVETTARVTRSGTMIGTPEYMSPEQSQASHVDQRSDIYAMGVMLYEVLTGRLPFQGPTPVAVILQHVKDPPPPPSTVRPELSPVWDEIVARALAKNPAERYPTAGAMDEAIQAALQRVERESGAWRQVGGVDAGVLDTQALYASATRALSDGDWQRVISLCGQILDADPAHPEAVRLLNHAHEALRRQRGDVQSERGHELVREAEGALAAEQLPQARQLFEEARALGAPEAASGLVRVQQAEERASLYLAARQVLAAERWDEAIVRLDQLAAQAPGYRDVAALRAHAVQAQQQARLATVYDQGMAALRAGDYPRAITAFRQITGQAPAFRDTATRLDEAQQAQEAAPRLTAARASLAAGRPDEAVALLETVVRTAPLVHDAQTLLAEARTRVHESTQQRAAGAAGALPPTMPGGQRPSVPPGTPSRDGNGAGAWAPVEPHTPRAAPVPPLTAPAAASTMNTQTGMAPPPGADATSTGSGWQGPPTQWSDGGMPTQVAGPRTLQTGGVAAPPVAMPTPMPAPSRGRLWLFLLAGLAALALVAVAAASGAVERIIGPRPTAVPTAVPTTVPATAVPTPTAAELFPACQNAVSAGNFAEAQTACERVAEREAEFAGLADALATTYVNLGKQQLDRPDGLAAATELFDKALAAKPDDGEAVKQRDLARGFADGEAALAAGDFDAAAERFEQVYREDEKYREGAGDGGVRNKAFEARLAAGQAALGEGRAAIAEQRCRRALELVGDSGAARDCVNQAVEAQRPPPTAVPAAAPPQQQQQAPRPQPTAVPQQQQAPRPQPTAVPAQPTARPQPTAVPVQPTARPQPTAAPAPPTRAPVQVPPTRPPY